jgi:hypothetical protein
MNIGYDMKWDWDKDLKDFKVISENLRLENQGSRADAIDYLIARCKRAEENKPKKRSFFR